MPEARVSYPGRHPGLLMAHLSPEGLSQCAHNISCFARLLHTAEAGLACAKPATLPVQVNIDGTTLAEWKSELSERPTPQQIEVSLLRRLGLKV